MITERDVLLNVRNFIAAELWAHPRTNDNRYLKLKDLLSEIDIVLNKRTATQFSSAPEAGRFPDATTAYPSEDK